MSSLKYFIVCTQLYKLDLKLKNYYNIHAHVVPMYITHFKLMIVKY